MLFAQAHKYPASMLVAFWESFYQLQIGVVHKFELVHKQYTVWR